MIITSAAIFPVHNCPIIVQNNIIMNTVIVEAEKTKHFFY